MMTFEIGMGVWVVLANVLAYVLFLRDKRAAIRGARRIPEDRLLAVAFLGGWLGAKLAQHLLRHSTLALSEIALSCGFASASHFSNRFRQAFGGTPGHYRASVQSR